MDPLGCREERVVRMKVVRVRIDDMSMHRRLNGTKEQGGIGRLQVSERLFKPETFWVGKEHGNRHRFEGYDEEPECMSDFESHIIGHNKEKIDIREDGEKKSVSNEDTFGG